MIHFIGVYDYTVILTHLSLISSVFGMTQAIHGDYKAAIFCLALSGICDAFDGRVARSKKNRTEDEKNFGIQLDSLCDVVCFGVFPALLCYLLGFRLLGKEFIAYSVVAGGSFSIFYAIFEQFPPLWPQLADTPLLAAIVGSLFVGIGVGLCVRIGSAPTGDDSLALSLSSLLKVKIQWVYLASDLIVLALSISYIPLGRLAYSLLTVILSGQIIGFVQRAKLPTKETIS